MGMGVLVLRGEECLATISKTVEHLSASSNKAEYEALKLGVNWINEHGYAGQSVHFMGDSKLVVEQMNGRWRMHNGPYLSSAKAVGALLMKLPNWKMTWIPREQNGRADELSKVEPDGWYESTDEDELTLEYKAFMRSWPTVAV